MTVVLVVMGFNPALADSILTGDYFGSVAVDSPAGLGNIDLAFHLTVQSGGAIDTDHSYIILDKTILFPKRDVQIDNMDVGPKIQSGSFTGTTSLSLAMTTESFMGTVSNKTVTRTVTLSGVAQTTRGDSITGTYTEEISGYLSSPMTIKGTFVLVRPISITTGGYSCKYMDTLSPTGELTIEEIRASGSNPAKVEFEDISCALYLYYHPGQGPSVSQATIQQAISEYKSFLQEK